MLRTHVPGRRFMTIWPKTRLTRIALVLASAFLFYSATTYFGAPAVIRYLAQNQAATILRRRVSVGRIKFNPYRLRLVIADLRVAGRDGSQHFIDVGRIDLRLSWTSLSHLAVVIKELTVERPSIRVARLGPQSFDSNGDTTNRVVTVYKVGPNPHGVPVSTPGWNPVETVKVS